MTKTAKRYRAQVALHKAVYADVLNTLTEMSRHGDAEACFLGTIGTANRSSNAQIHHVVLNQLLL